MQLLYTFGVLAIVVGANGGRSYERTSKKIFLQTSNVESDLSSDAPSKVTFTISSHVPCNITFSVTSDIPTNVTLDDSSDITTYISSNKSVTIVSDTPSDSTFTITSDLPSNITVIITSDIPFNMTSNLPSDKTVTVITAPSHARSMETTSTFGAIDTGSEDSMDMTSDEDFQLPSTLSYNRIIDRSSKMPHLPSDQTSNEISSETLIEDDDPTWNLEEQSEPSSSQNNINSPSNMIFDNAADITSYIRLDVPSETSPNMTTDELHSVTSSLPFDMKPIEVSTEPTKKAPLSTQNLDNASKTSPASDNSMSWDQLHDITFYIPLYVPSTPSDMTTAGSFNSTSPLHAKWTSNRLSSKIRKERTTEAPEAIVTPGKASDPASSNASNIRQPVVAAIHGGQTAFGGQFPFMVVVHSIYTYDNAFTTCGGTVISDRWVLTAAHCVNDHPDRIFLVFGDADKGNIVGAEYYHGPGVAMYADFVKPHPGYSTIGLPVHDIAVIHASRRIPLGMAIKKIDLAGTVHNHQHQTFARKFGTILGWGATSNAHSASQLLQSAKVPIKANEQCAKSWPYIRDDEICAKPYYGREACVGDSGGPLLVQSMGTHKYLQVGIVSYGGLDCPSKRVNIFTRISAYSKWIADTTGLQF